jgi:hypothetical protein
MWLGETAINMVTVECLIEEKIGYVILSPNQVESFRHIDGGNWTHNDSERIDTRRPYRIFPRTQSGERLEGHLDVFFFDEGLSKEISFNDILKDSRVLGNRINECYDEHNGANQLVTIATDGETFGHHKAFGDMCLAFFFKSVACELGIKPVNFGYYLSINPPQHEVTLKNAFGEGTAWSCAHGVGRWSRDCGCSTGGEEGWNQAWRAPLRSSLNELQSQIDSHYEARLATIFDDPWALRDKYISIMGESSLAKTAEFLKSRAPKVNFNEELTAEIRRLLEAQKFMLFSYTSCGWFFNDISGIETVQNLAYACRALQLGLPQVGRSAALFQFLEQLSKAKSNVKDTDGRTLFEKHILPFFHHERLLAFTAAAQQILAIKKYSSYEKTVYNLELKSVMSQKAGRMNYDAVDVQMESGITGESSSWSVLIAHSPETELRGWVVNAKTLKAHTLAKPDSWISHPDVKTFTLGDLFYSSRQDLSDYFQDRMAKDTDKRFMGWMEQNEQNLNVLTRLNYPLPAYCSTPVAYVLQNRWNTQIHNLRKWGNEDEVFADLQEVDSLEKLYDINIDKKQSALTLQNLIIRGLETLQQEPSIEVCGRLRSLLNFVDKFSIPVSKSKLEDIFHPVYEGPLKTLYGEYAADNKSVNKELLENLVGFARRMNFNTDRYTI